MSKKLKIALIGEPGNSITQSFASKILRDDSLHLCCFLDGSINDQTKEKLYGKVARSEGMLKSLVKTILLHKYWGKKGSDQLLLDQMRRDRVRVEVPKNNNLNKGLPAQLFELEVDYVLIAGCDQLIKSQLLQWPKSATINYHYSPLPSYRGKYSLFWQWYNEEPKIGFSFHKVDLGIDTGEVVFQKWASTDPLQAYETVASQVVQESAETIPELFQCLEENRTNLIDPTPEESYFHSSAFLDLPFLQSCTSSQDLEYKFRKLKHLKLNDEYVITGLSTDKEEDCPSFDMFDSNFWVTEINFGKSDLKKELNTVQSLLDKLKNES